MRGEDQLLNRIRSVMAPANPVSADAYEGDTGYFADLAERITTRRSAGLVVFEQPARRRVRPSPPGQDGRGSTAWRLVAPALSGLAVVAVVVSLTLVAGQRPAARRPGGGVTAAGATALPRFYITINNKVFLKPATVFVHSSATGRTLGSVSLPKSIGLFVRVAATKSDREFYIVADRIIGANFKDVAGLYRLRLAANGHVQSFTTLSTNLGGVGVNNTVGGISLSPDGTKLAVGVQITLMAYPDSEIVVIPLNHGPRRTWITRKEVAYLWDPIWTSNKDIAFVWRDHLRGPNTDYTVRSAERLLDTTAPGSNLLSSRVLATSTSSDKLGSIETAFAIPGGGPIIAATAKNVPSVGVPGQATARLVALSPVTGKVIKVFATQARRYRNLTTRLDADFFFFVYGLDSTGKHALVNAPRFGVLTAGKFTRLPGGPGEVLAAGW